MYDVHPDILHRIAAMRGTDVHARHVAEDRRRRRQRRRLARARRAREHPSLPIVTVDRREVEAQLDHGGR